MDRAAAIALLESEGLVVTEWHDDAGALYEEHAHPGLEVRVVLEGSMTVTLAGAERELGPGDRIDIGPHQPHRARVGPVGVRYLAGSRR